MYKYVNIIPHNYQKDPQIPPKISHNDPKNIKNTPKIP